MYPHVGVDASGLATLRATVQDLLRGFVPTAYAVPALAVAAAPVGPCYALAEGGATVGPGPVFQELFGDGLGVRLV
ncbi:hypothetical protein ACWEWQ_16280, partial [Streptomyces sp. NPDC003832]